MQRGSRVLEIGTGSGYQAAILAELSAEVSAIEIVPQLARQAARALRRRGYRKSMPTLGTALQAGPSERRSTR